MSRPPRLVLLLGLLGVGAALALASAGAPGPSLRPLALAAGGRDGPARATSAPSAGDAASATPATLPGAPPIPPATIEKIRVALSKRKAERPRTRHLLADGSAKYTNRLVLESSPYLQQHSHNPVDWFPWGDEAFAAAARLGRPVLLSVGYSTCHWCHVMEEESFEDEEIARFLNESYVAIKVDREERPDIDAIYMAAVQAMTGRGGWPMTVWLTPDRKPFFGGTYFPARDGDRGSGPGFLTLLSRLAEAYRAEPASILESSSRLAEAVKGQLVAGTGKGTTDASILAAAAAFYEGRYDPVFGGLKGAPKFPSSLPVRLLLREARRTGDLSLREMATRTLDRMAEGGLHDHVGGGFHRYSVDGEWGVPHFEKMLYDNALLVLGYLEGYQVTGEKRYAQVARATLAFVDREMTSPDGAFYSAIDADSETPAGKREEGWFYTWSPREVDLALGSGRGRAARAWFGVTDTGNLDGRSVLTTRRSLDEVARELAVPKAGLAKTLESARSSLYEARSRRPRPLRDQKSLAAWNGLMISAYSRAAFVLGDESYARTASRAGRFLLEKMRRGGRLARSIRDGRPGPAGYLEDYAFVTAAMLDLFEATGEPRWLGEAVGLDRVLGEHFEDAGSGGFYRTSDDAEVLLARDKPGYDGAEPSGNSVHVLNLQRLGALTGNDSYRRRAEAAVSAFSGALSESPTALAEMLLALDFRAADPREIVIVVPRSRADAEPLLSVLRKAFVPASVLVVVAEGPALDRLSGITPLARGKTALEGRATAYVCRQGACLLPTSSVAIFETQLRSAGKRGGPP